ncbi:MAG TPA: hypothetical protein VGO47_06390 [Chlamydiales bacterium]|nr:hypothetical protein [Chlamydiales bacterium]
MTRPSPCKNGDLLDMDNEVTVHGIWDQVPALFLDLFDYKFWKPFSLSHPDLIPPNESNACQMDLLIGCGSMILITDPFIFFDHVHVQDCHESYYMHALTFTKNLLESHPLSSKNRQQSRLLRTFKLLNQKSEKGTRLLYTIIPGVAFSHDNLIAHLVGTSFGLFPAGRL